MKPRHTADDPLPEPSLNESKPAILIIGHGTRDEAGVRQFHSLVAHFRDRFPDRKCATGFLEFARPTIGEGLRELLNQGATRITAIPGMLMAAGHAKNDIPSEINELQAKHPTISIVYGAELGVDAKMLRAARDRIEEAEAEIRRYHDYESEAKKLRQLADEEQSP